MNITVTKNQVSVNTDYILNDKEYNVNQCYFTFSDEYTDDLVKKAIFVQGTTTIEMSIINNQCQIPAEVLNNGQFELRVYAYEVDGDELSLRYSPSYTTAYVRTGSYIENAESPEVITPTQFEQYMQAMNDGLNEVANVDIDAEQLDDGMSVTITNRYGEDKTVYAYDGEKGETGATPNIQIGTVVTGDHSEVTRTGTNENPIFNFVLEKGDKGDTGNGIASVTKTSTSGLVDTYTITYTNGTTTTFNVTNGKSITNIAKTSTSGLEDTYTITYNDNTTSTFTVTNGNGISSIEKTGTQDNVDTYTIYYTNGTTSTFTVTNSTVTNQEFEELKSEHEELVNTLPRVEGTGTSVTLDNTAQYKMNVALSGNTSQVQYTGKNLWGGFTFSKTNNSVAFTYNVDGTITADGTSTGTARSMNSTEATTNNYTVSLLAGTYTLSGGTTNVNVEIVGTDGQNISSTGGQSSTTFTLTETTIAFVRLYVANTIQVNNQTFNVQLEKSNEITSYEPYVGGVPSPNPLYPQPIKKVTGNNSITVCGKNLWGGFNYSVKTADVDYSYVSNGTINANGTASNVNSYSANGLQVFNNKLYVILPAGTYTASVTDLPSNTSWQIGESRIDSTTLNILSSPSTTYKTFTLSKETRINIRIHPANGTQVTNATVKVMLVHGDTALEWEPYTNQTYPINLGSLEYCEIGNYSDKFALSTGVQLFDKNNANIFNGYIASVSPYDLKSSNNSKTFYLKIKPNTTYTISKISSTYFRTGYTTELPTAGVVVSGFDNSILSPKTITTSENAQYLVCTFWTNSDTLTEQQILDSIMINEGSTPLPWQPYGIGNWYLKKNIGKVVLDGSTDENWTYGSTNTTNIKRMVTTILINSIVKPVSASTLPTILSDYYTPKTANQTYSLDVGISVTSAGYVDIYDSTYNTTDVDLYKAWLSTHNVTVYYALATPIDEPITDTTLIEQLTNLYNQIKSYKGQTNITQTNAELPFNIDASALYDLNNLISRVATLETEV